MSFTLSDRKHLFVFQIQERENVFFREIFPTVRTTTRECLWQSYFFSQHTWRADTAVISFFFHRTVFHYFLARARKILILILKYHSNPLNINLCVPVSRECWRKLYLKTSLWLWFDGENVANCRGKVFFTRKSKYLLIGNFAACKSFFSFCLQSFWQIYRFRTTWDGIWSE